MIASASSWLRCIPIVVLLFGSGCLRVDEEPSPATGRTEQLLGCPIPLEGSPTTNNVPCDPVCGDGICASSETCSTCPADCGSCPPAHHYTCGYAISGFNCNNGRGHTVIFTVDMTAAISICKAIKPASTPDSCYVIDSDGALPLDPSECSAGGGSWRSGNNCCNFMGTLSCP